jgi:hypothetical protein
MKKTIEEVKKYLLENRIDKNGDLNLNFLDFSDFDRNVLINNMKVKEDLFQRDQEVGDSLYQEGQKVGGDIYQGYQEVIGNLFQHDNNVLGHIYEEDNREEKWK